MLKNPFHLVDSSPWPVLASVSLLNFALGTVVVFHGESTSLTLPVGIASLALVMMGWFKDVNNEGAFLGSHTTQVKAGLTAGFLLFVATEVMFFISIFWAFLHTALAPAVELGTQWPPAGINALSPWNLPLLNTVLLLSSGASLTAAHHFVVSGKRGPALTGLAITVSLSVIFTLCQGVEFLSAPFSLADSAYATAFYFGTTFHGVHVILGTVMLSVAGWRFLNYYFTSQHCAGMEGAILYWHIVDVV